MAPPGDPGLFVAFLLTQGVGGLFVVLVSAILYLHRRRPYFLFWTLSWLCFSLWALLRGAALSDGGAAGVWIGLGDAAAWGHAALWVLGLWAFQRDGPAAGGPRLAQAAPVLAVGLAGAVAALLLPRPLHDAVLAVALAAVYAGSAGVLLLAWLRRRRIGRLVLGLSLALSAAFQVLVAAAPTPRWAAFADLLLPTFVAVGMILVLLVEEETLLQETLRRLAESEDRFRVLFEHGGAGLALQAADGAIVEANPALEEMLGYGPGELAGRRMSDLVHPDDRSDDTRRMRQASPPHPFPSPSGGRGEGVRGPAGDQTEREKRYLRRDGGVLWARVVRAVVRDAAGQVRYHASVLMDVTERRRAEEGLRRTEEALRQERDFIALVLQTADALVLVMDRAGRVVRFNAKCAAVSGRTEDEVRGRPIWELLPERVVDSVRAGFARLEGVTAAIAEPTPPHMEIPWRTPDGRERLIAWRPSLVYEPDGPVRYVIGVGVDVTEQRRLEGQVRQAQKLETLATLVGGIAHDFNNQLTAVIGNLSLVLEDLRAADGHGRETVPQQGVDAAPQEGVDAEALRMWAEAADEAAQRCAAMTSRLLTFSRGRIGALHPMRLHHLLPEAARLLQAELPPAIRVEVHAAGEAWPVNGDWAQLHQVIHALAANARDAMPQGGVLTLEVANRDVGPEEAAADLEARPGRFVELLVRDDGAGMTPEVRARLFEPYFTTKPAGQGAGLGLSEAYGIIKGHGGWIEVESAPGRGSAFRVYLPAAEAAPPAAPPAAAAGQGGGECVLVVDDEDMVRDLARIVLERRGYRVLTASDGEEALTQYGAHPGQIDLVLLDYSMPGLTGLQVFEALRQMDPAVCVVFSSGYGLAGDASPLLAAGARAFVPKPYRPDELAGALRRVLDEKEAKRAALEGR